MGFKPLDIIIRAKDESGSVIDGLSNRLKAVGALIAGYFGIKAFAGAVQGAAELEAKLSEVKAVSGANADEMQRLRKAAEDAGATTKYSATEAAEALGELTRAGQTANQAIETLPATMQLAQAGGIALGDSSAILTRTLAGFNLEAKESGRVADVLAMGANASNTSVKGLADGLSYAAPTAKALGLSLETTVAILGKFADAGIDASRGGTALNAIMAQFSDPASKFRQELALAGVTTNDFEKAIHQLAAAGPQGQRAVLAVGTEAGPALRALLNQGMGALDELKAKLQDASGSAAETAAVMDNNLSGAARGLASVWDAVKNALATPVLPALKDGVEWLTAALRASIADGTIGKWGDAVANMFRGGIAWAKNFAGSIDFAAVTTKLQEWADKSSAFFQSVEERATQASNVAQTVFGVMSAGINGLLTLIYGMGASVTLLGSQVQAVVADILDGLAKVTFGDMSAGFKVAAEEMRVSAGATEAAAQALADKARDSFQDMADGAQTARDGWDALKGASAGAASQAAVGNQVMKTVSETLKEVGGDATATGQKAQAAAVLQKQAAETVRAAVAELKGEYEAALGAGNVQLALDKLDTMRKALKATTGEAKATGAEVEAAFTRLGVTSTEELKRTRDAALRDYQTIRDSGTATPRDIAEAFAAYAKTAVAANNGVATGVLKAEAAMRGLKLEVDATGNVVVTKMRGAANETQNAGNAARGAASGYTSLASATNSAASAVERLRSLQQSGAGGGGGSNPYSQFTDKQLDDYYQRYGQFARPGKDTVNDEIDRRDREERLKGNGPAVDSSGMFEAERKLNAGTLTKDDIPLIQGVLQAIRSAQAGNDALVGLRSLDGHNDTMKWANIGARLAQVLPALQGQAQDPSGSTPTTGTKAATSSETSTTVRTVKFDLSLNGTSYGSVSTDAASEANMQQWLAALARSKGVAL